MHSKIEAASFQVVCNACNHACNQYGTHVPFTPCATPPRDHSKQPLFMFTGPPAGPSEGQQWFNNYRQGRTPFNNLLCLGQYFLLCLAELWNVLCFTADRWAAVRTRHNRLSLAQAAPKTHLLHLNPGRLSLIHLLRQQRNQCGEISPCAVRRKESHMMLISTEIIEVSLIPCVMRSVDSQNKWLDIALWQTFVCRGPSNCIKFETLDHPFCNW